jgi:hypothetical protein
MLVADHQQVLARRAVPPGRIVLDAAIADVHPVHDRIARRRAALDDPSAYHRNVVGGGATDNDLHGGSTRLVAAAGTVHDSRNGNAIGSRCLAVRQGAN